MIAYANCDVEIRDADRYQEFMRQLKSAFRNYGLTPP